MHYIIIIGIIILIVVYQLKIYNDTQNKLVNFRQIFSDDKDSYKLLNDKNGDILKNANEDKLVTLLEDNKLNSSGYYFTRYTVDNGDVTIFRREKAIDDLTNLYQNEHVQIVAEGNINGSFLEISNSINEYLSANKGAVSDFHLMKDIVDRNCDTIEEEINTQIPVPLYLGLVGTMIGILVGIGYLWLSGGLSDLLNSENGSSGAEGVKALLGGVALAMFASTIGILLTTIGSMKAKTVKAEVEQNKHNFLSWIQASLLPNLTNDTAQTLEKMSQNLVSFNNTFSDNTSNLGAALTKVNESYKLQTQLIDAVNKIQEGRTASTNLALLSKLIESSEQIGKLAEYLNNTNEYLRNVKALNEKLDANEQRMIMLEDMGKFFKDEISQIEQRKTAISKAVGTVDDKLRDALSRLTDNTTIQIEEYKKLLGKQQDTIQQKIPEITILVDELKKLSAVKESISKFEDTMLSQNKKIDNLISAVLTLAKTNSDTRTEKLLTSHLDPTNSQKQERSRLKTIAIWSSSSISGILLILFIIANWESIHSTIVEIFKL